MIILPRGKLYKLANGDPVEVVSTYNDRIVVLYNGMRLDRPADLIGRVLFPADESLDTLSAPEREKLTTTFTHSKSPDHMRRKVIHSGDTVCIKFIETGRKAVYTLTDHEPDVTVHDGEYPDEGIVSERSAFGIAVMGMGTNDIVTYYHGDGVIVIQILSFFLKKEGIYQRMKEQKDAQKMLDQQKKKRKAKERQMSAVPVARAIRTGNTVCIEFLDTHEKKAFKIVEARVEVHGEYAAKPYRPTSYDSKTITDADPDEDTISETSPLARALMGKKRGDIASYTVGSHKTQMRVIAFFDNDRWLQMHKQSEQSTAQTAGAED